MFEFGDLPSGTSAKALVQGDMKALPEAVLHTTLRAGLIGTGMYIAGFAGSPNPSGIERLLGT
jgi:hypothetical protein